MESALGLLVAMPKGDLPERAQRLGNAFAWMDSGNSAHGSMMGHQRKKGNAFFASKLHPVA